ncbi:MAG: response regulator transcription factor [Bacteroidetes bacterium]|nr:MAG: response regulator transcription factor [Bacteroidota bacterium]
MQLKCVAIDDEPLALQLIREYVEKFPELRMVQTFDDGINGAEFLRNNEIDLLFIDISMPDVTGIELVGSLEKKPLTIFTTAYKNFAFEGFELEAIDYLVKPIDFERFSKAATKAIEFFQYKQNTKEQAQASLFVRSEYKIVKIDLAEIEYIEALQDYVKIHLTHDKPVLALMTLKSVLGKLPADRFKRIHRSYIVPIAKVQSILNRKARLASGAELPISNNYLDFIDHWLKK